MWYYGAASLTFTPEVQTIKMSSSVFGGTFSLVSPGGHVYPYPIPFDIDGPGLALVLMRLPDVSAVKVSKNLLADGGASVTWQVTFLHQAQGQQLPSPPLTGPLMVKPAGLLSINGTTLAVCSGGVATAGSYTAPPCDTTDSALARYHPLSLSINPISTLAINTIRSVASSLPLTILPPSLLPSPATSLS